MNVTELNRVPVHPYVVISGPSGVGKNTIVEAMLERFPQLQKATTYTSRDPRPGEVEAKMKYFVSEDEFKQKIANNEFFEWAEYAGNYYGTPRKELLNLLQDGPAITDTETQGVEQLMQTFPKEKFITIFLKPSSVEDLVVRIKERAPISEEELEKRIERMEKELARAEKYDLTLVNKTGEVEKTIEQVAEYLKTRFVA